MWHSFVFCMFISSVNLNFIFSSHLFSLRCGACITIICEEMNSSVMLPLCIVAVTLPLKCGFVSYIQLLYLNVAVLWTSIVDATSQAGNTPNKHSVSPLLPGFLAVHLAGYSSSFEHHSVFLFCFVPQCI